MANWALTSYAIEGPKDVLEKIEQAILHHSVEESSDESWEGNVLIELGIEWERRDPSVNPQTGKYMRGFIYSDPWMDGGVLHFDAEEAWGVTDFNEVLEENLPVKVYWFTEEHDMEVFETNDKDSKYFVDKYCVDGCVNDDYVGEWFTNKKAALDYISDITDGKIKTEDDIDKFNEERYDIDKYVHIHEVKIV